MRKRFKLDHGEWRDTVQVLERHLYPYTDAQEDGTAFYGEALNTAQPAQHRTAFFCPLPVDPPEQPGPRSNSPCRAAPR